MRGEQIRVFVGTPVGAMRAATMWSGEQWLVHLLEPLTYRVLNKENDDGRRHGDISPGGPTGS
jgi:hypothetical protein